MHPHTRSRELVEAACQPGLFLYPLPSLGSPGGSFLPPSFRCLSLDCTLYFPTKLKTTRASWRREREARPALAVQGKTSQQMKPSQTRAGFPWLPCLAPPPQPTHSVTHGPLLCGKQVHYHEVVCQLLPWTSSPSQPYTSGTSVSGAVQVFLCPRPSEMVWHSDHSCLVCLFLL